jgi:hypothetical protein
MASATPSASVPGESIPALEEKGVGELRHHAAWSYVAAAVIAAMRASLPLSTPNDRAFARTHYKHVSPRHLSQSCDKCWNLAITMQGANKEMGKDSTAMRSSHTRPTR